MMCWKKCLQLLKLTFSVALNVKKKKVQNHQTYQCLFKQKKKNVSLPSSGVFQNNSTHNSSSHLVSLSKLQLLKVEMSIILLGYTVTPNSCNGAFRVNKKLQDNYHN